MTDLKLTPIAFSCSPPRIGDLRASLFQRTCRAHQRTRRGWEPVPVNEEVEKLLITGLALLDRAATPRAFRAASDRHDRPYRLEGQISTARAILRQPSGPEVSDSEIVQRVWFTVNDVGEPLALEEAEVPLAARCDLLALAAASLLPAEAVA